MIFIYNVVSYWTFAVEIFNASINFKSFTIINKAAYNDGEFDGDDHNHGMNKKNTEKKFVA